MKKQAVFTIQRLNILKSLPKNEVQKLIPEIVPKRGNSKNENLKRQQVYSDRSIETDN